MSINNEKENKGEWLNQNLQVCVIIGEHTLCRNYALEDGVVPESALEGLQELTDTLLDTSELK